MSAQSLAGAWKGIYASNGNVIDADLTLRFSAGTLDGDVHIKTVMSKARHFSETRTSAAWKVTTTFDPLTRTLNLQPSEIITPSDQVTIEPVPMLAVYATARDELAGEAGRRFGNSADVCYFAFTRGDRQSIKKLEDAAVDCRSVADDQSPSLLSMMNSSPADEALMKWADEYKAHFPADADGVVHDVTLARSLPLLLDREFMPVFGKTYDGIGPAAIGKIINRFESHSGSGYAIFAHDNKKLSGKLSFGKTILEPTPEKLVAVRAVRVIDAWQTETARIAATLPPTVDSFHHLVQLEKSLQAHVTYNWPGASPFAADFAADRKQLAPRILAVRADAAVRSTSVHDLSRFEQENRQFLAYASPSDRSAVLHKVDTRLDELLASQIQARTAQLASFGSGLKAVQDEDQWYHGMMADYQTVAGRPPVRAAIAQLVSRRPGDLASAQPEIVAELKNAKSSDELAAPLAVAFAVPGDQATPAGIAIASAVAKQRESMMGGGGVNPQEQIRFTFDGPVQSDGLPQGWQSRIVVGQAQCQVQKDLAGTNSLRVICDHSHFVVWREVTPFDCSKYPVIAWSWEANALPPNGDSRTHAAFFLGPNNHNDKGLQLMVGFEGDCVLNYVWDSNAPVGYECDEMSPVATIKTLVVDSGPPTPGNIRDHQIDVRADFIRRFGREPGRIRGVGISANTNHTSSFSDGEISVIRALPGETH